MLKHRALKDKLQQKADRKDRKARAANDVKPCVCKTCKCLDVRHEHREYWKTRGDAAEVISLRQDGNRHLGAWP